MSFLHSTRARTLGVLLSVALVIILLLLAISFAEVFMIVPPWTVRAAAHDDPPGLAGESLAGSVYAVAANGTDVYVAGEFTSIGNVSAKNLAKWNRSSGVWSSLGDGVNGVVHAIAISGSDVYVGGNFTAAINPGGSSVAVYSIARWTGSSWAALGAAAANGNGVNGDVAAIAINGSNIYVTGEFNIARNSASASVSANGVVRWNGSAWSALGSGSGATGNGVSSPGHYYIYAIAVNGNDVYVGGSFTKAYNNNGSEISANCVARWNSATNTWAALGTGNGPGTNGVNGDVLAIAVNGSDIYVAGAFTSTYNSSSAQINSQHIARWNGSAWSALGSGTSAGGNGVNSSVTSLAVSNGVVYVGGEFDTAYNGTGGGVNTDCIARWNGSAWSAVGDGMDSSVFALAANGADLFAGGDFTVARNSNGSVNASNVARWNGTQWAAFSAGSTTGALANVSAASFGGTELAAESIAAAFGADLATATQLASVVPLPTTLAGTTVKVKDALGVERTAPLFFVAPLQVNYQVPVGTAAGATTVTITASNGKISVGTVQISTVAPGLFTANANGQGVAAATALRVRSNGSQQFESIAQFDQAQNKFIPTPIDLGPSTDQVFLVLSGVGVRNRSSLSAVTAQIGGTAAEVLFAGPQGSFVGLDQINLRIPRTLAGRGEVDVALTVGGKTANVVKVSIK